MKFKVKIGNKEYQNILSINLHDGQITYADNTGLLHFPLFDEVELFVKIKEEWLKLK